RFSRDWSSDVCSSDLILTFFPWKNVRQGKNGAGMATEIGYSVPKGSLEFWKKRFENLNVRHDIISERFGEKQLPFQDPDGLWLRSEERRVGKEGRARL